MFTETQNQNLIASRHRTEKDIKRFTNLQTQTRYYHQVIVNIARRTSIM